MFVLWLACGTDPSTSVTTPTDLPGATDTPSPPPSETDPTVPPTNPTFPSETHTVTGTGPGVLSATCSPDADNTLRQHCAVQTGDPGPAHVVVWKPGDPTAETWTSDLDVTVHELTINRLRPLTTYEWQAWTPTGPGEVSGTFTTGALPSSVDFVGLVEDTPEATVDTIVMPYNCGRLGMLVAVDRSGTPVWYEDTADLLGLTIAKPINGMQVSEEDHSLVAVLEHDEIIELDTTGHLLTDLNRGVDWDADEAVHHDITKVDGDIVALRARGESDGIDTFIVDGFLRFDPAGQLVDDWTLWGLWDLSGYLPPPTGYWGNEFGLDAIDVTHSNGVSATTDGDLVLSLRHLDTVLQVAGANRPDAGAVDWTLVGTLDVPVPSTYLRKSSALVSPTDFQVQHHASFTQDGHLIFLDNRQFSPSSRVVEWALDPVALTADLLDEYEIGEWCVVQGGVYELPSGNLLATCATAQKVIEFARGGEQVWSFQPDCGGFAFTSLIRAEPIELH